MSNVRWNDKVLRERMRAILRERMELLGKVAETRARERLLAIEKPISGRAYRREIVARRLTHVLQETADGVTVTVGVRMGTKPVKGAETIGLYIELGSRTAPAQPYLRQSVFGDARDLVKLLGGGR